MTFKQNKFKTVGPQHGRLASPLDAPDILEGNEGRKIF